MINPIDFAELLQRHQGEAQAISSPGGAVV
jgi:hypothetical protein